MLNNACQSGNAGLDFPPILGGVRHLEYSSLTMEYVDSVLERTFGLAVSNGEVIALVAAVGIGLFAWTLLAVSYSFLHEKC